MDIIKQKRATGFKYATLNQMVAQYAMLTQKKKKEVINWNQMNYENGKQSTVLSTAHIPIVFTFFYHFHTTRMSIWEKNE